MNERRRIEERLRKKEQEIEFLEEQIKAARAYIQALHDVLKMLPKGPEHSVPAESVLRHGSAVAKAREVILKRRQPVQILDLLIALNKEPNRENRSSLTSSLAAYVRRGEIFTRPAPNTFGLIELGHHTSDQESNGPPAGFGSVNPSAMSPIEAPRPKLVPRAQVRTAVEESE